MSLFFRLGLVQFGLGLLDEGFCRYDLFLELGLLVSIYLQCVVDRYAQDLVVFEADVARGEGSRVDDFAVSDRVAHDAEVVFELGYGGVGNENVV